MWFYKLPVLLVVGFTAATLYASASSAQQQTTDSYGLQNINDLINASSYDLAEKLLKENSPEFGANEEWIKWARQLWLVYRKQGNWEQLYESASLPQKFSQQIRKQADLHRIDALLKLGSNSAARDLIRKQIFYESSSQHKNELYKMLVQSYIKDDFLSDARVLVRKFNQEYSVPNNEWLLLSAGILVRSGEYAAAINILAPMTQSEARLLRLYARLQDGSIPINAVIEGVEELAKKASGQLRRELSAVSAAAHLKANDNQSAANALESYLAAPPSASALQGIYPNFSAQDLVGLYSQIAEKHGNDKNLLRGDDTAWIKSASQIKQAIIRKSIYAYTLISASESSGRSSAVSKYVKAIINSGHSGMLLKVFGKDKPLGELRVNGPTGVRLAEHSWGVGNVALAAAAFESLSHSRSGLEHSDWLVRSARVDIFTGDPKSANEKLNEWLETVNKPVSPKQVDVFLQPVFDLQIVGQHKIALGLLNKLNKLSISAKHKREIAYWLADSYFEEGKYVSAANLYIQSAMMAHNGFDQWGEAARARAANALIKISLFDDARRIYQDMLSVSENPDRRAQIQQKIQEISILKTNVESQDE